MYRWRERELQEDFEKDALFYLGILRLQKIMNTEVACPKDVCPEFGRLLSPTAYRETIFFQLLWKAETPQNTQAENAFIQTRKCLFREVSSHNHNGP